MCGIPDIASSLDSITCIEPTKPPPLARPNQPKVCGKQIVYTIAWNSTRTVTTTNNKPKTYLSLPLSNEI